MKHRKQTGTYENWFGHLKLKTQKTKKLNLFFFMRTSNLESSTKFLKAHLTRVYKNDNPKEPDFYRRINNEAKFQKTF